MSEGWSYFLDFNGEAFELQAGEMTVGRSRSCDVSINDPSVSRRHVVLEAEGGRVKLHDLGSSNGTFINGNRVQGDAELHHGDTLGLGDADLKVRVEGMSAFETVRMSARPAAPHGDATLFLQQASDRLANEAMDLGQAAQAPASHMAPPPPPRPAAPAASHMAPPPVQRPSPAPLPQPSPVAAQPPPVPAPPAAAKVPPPPAVPAAPRAAAPVAASVPPRESVLDRTTGDLLPSLDGFDTTMGPEMLAALVLDGKERPAETPAVNPYGAPAAGQQPAAAGFGIRLAATLVDGAWMAALQLMAYFGDQGLGSFVASTAASVAGLSVVLFGWAIWGATPGKRVFHLHVSTGAGSQAGIGFPRAMARLVGYVISTLPLGAGFLMIALSKSKRGLHDLIAGTLVRRHV